MIEEDFEAWQAFPHHRWLFNKLEVALSLDYNAGPTGVPITESGHYIIRPTYNLYGMGIGAKKVYLDVDKDAEDMINLAHVPPGYFWCEYFVGPHYSIDYQYKDGVYVPFSASVGVHRSEDDLIQFDYWKVIDMPQEAVLPSWVHDLKEPRPMILNAEFKGSKLFEIHLRSGNDHLWDLPVDTIVYPVWKNEIEPEWMSELPFIGNLHNDSIVYSAHGQLDHVRLGYRIQFPK